MKTADGIILPNIRFWLDWHGSPVKLTLHPGDTISNRCSRRHEDGWSSEGFELEYDARRLCLTVENWSHGTDCDGRYSSSSSAEASIIDCTDEGQPIWTRPEYYQPNYSAEAAGY